MTKQRLEALVGAPIGPESSPSVIERFVEIKAPEHSDLEFKLQMWEHTDKGREELAKDVTAMANAAGGLIVIGIATAKDTASLSNPFAVGDQHAREVLTVIAGRVFPHPQVDCYPVNDDAGNGFLVIDVPASPLAPHAVWDRQRGTLKYPVRTGTRTHYLTEADVAERYIQRGRRLERRPEDAAEIERELVDDMVLDDGPVLVVSLVPSTRSPHPLTRDFVDQTESWWRSQTQQTFGGGHGFKAAAVYASVGFGRTELGVTHEGPRRHFAAHLYVDGRIAFGQSAFDRRPSSPDNPWEVIDTQLALKALDQLSMCSAHLERLGVVGFVDVRLSLVDRVRSGRVIISQFRFGHGLKEIVGTLPDDRDDVYPFADTWTDTGTLAAGVGRTSLVHRLGSMLTSAFGLAELMPFAPSGAVRLSAFPQPERDAVRKSAERCLVPVEE